MLHDVAPIYASHVATFTRSMSPLVGNTMSAAVVPCWAGVALAEREHRKNLEERAALVAVEPANDEAKADLAASHTNLGVLLTRRKSWSEAMAEIASSERLLKSIAAPRPRDRADLGKAQMNLASIATLAKRPENVGRARVAAAETFTALAADFATVPEYRFLNAQAKINLGLWLHGTGNEKKALDQIAAARDILTALSREFADRPEYGEHLAICRGILEFPPPKKEESPTLKK